MGIATGTLEAVGICGRWASAHRMAEARLKALLHTKNDVSRRGLRYTVPTELIMRESTARVRGREYRARGTAMGNGALFRE